MHDGKPSLLAPLFLLITVMLIVFVVRVVPSMAQVLNPSPTPAGFALVQGAGNLGDVQPLPITSVVARTGLQAWRDAGWTGNGVKVGVIDQGFGGLSAFQLETGTQVQVLAGVEPSGYDASSITHGTEVLEVVHGIAPGATLYACAYDTYDQFAYCIDGFITNGVRIINHSAGVPALPLDGTNEWALQVDRAARAGVLWVNAAGNFAGGYISDVFTDNCENAYHEFRGGQGCNETLSITGSEVAAQGVALLSWEGRPGVPPNAIDLDLEVVNAANEPLGASRELQNGRVGERALERVTVDLSQDFGIRIRDVSGNGAGVRFVLFIEFVSVTGGSVQGAIIAPGDSQSALTVGAQQGMEVAPYSSRGPLITGVIKPDLVAPGELLLADETRFVGTSASAPVVAGFAALVWEAYPAFDHTQLFAFIRSSTQDDVQIAGLDSNYGQGRLFAPLPEVTLAPTAAPSPTATTEPTFTPEASATIPPTMTGEAPVKPTQPMIPTATSQSEITELTPQETGVVNATPDITVNEPCTVQTANERVSIHVGPGDERAVRAALSANVEYLVTGWIQAEDGSYWWRVQPPNIVTELDRYWVRQDQVVQVGACSSIPEVPASILIPQILDATPYDGSGGTITEFRTFSATLVTVSPYEFGDEYVLLNLYVPEVAQELTGSQGEGFIYVRTTFYADQRVVTWEDKRFSPPRLVFGGMSEYYAYLKRGNGGCMFGTRLTRIQIELRDAQNSQTYFTTTIPMDHTC